MLLYIKNKKNPTTTITTPLSMLIISAMTYQVCFGT